MQILRVGQLLEVFPSMHFSLIPTSTSTLTPLAPMGPALTPHCGLLQQHGGQEGLPEGRTHRIYLCDTVPCQDHIQVQQFKTISSATYTCFCPEMTYMDTFGQPTHTKVASAACS
ncbi:hypothetical protein NQD34_014106 [Periophthalmus magnuspinnatus]|nr:hypothetical protein NQD34_014106 [Periophthalmus magnuspinnatus]